MLGPAERNLKMVREAVGVNIAARDDTVRISGDRPAALVARAVLERLAAEARAGKPLDRPGVLEVISDELARAGDAPETDPDALERGRTFSRSRASGELAGHAWDGPMTVSVAGRPVRPQTDNQKAYLEAIRTSEMVFGVGPAGTGKTYLAVAAAVHMLQIGRVQRVILARPAVEAGERLGFLPGDLQEKVNPYLRPLLDALHDMLDFGTVSRFMQSGVIEIAPLAFMRGRTLNNAAILLDEAQNTTPGQMKMFLTRMGHGSRVIVTGDTTQIDLPDPTQSGLIDAARRLARLKGIAFIQLLGTDVVRHGLVQRVVEAYGEDEPSKSVHGVAIRKALEEADDAEDAEDGAQSDGA
ncbi:MAG: PhoH family protein [Planctomycetota bacterium]